MTQFCNLSVLTSTYGFVFSPLPLAPATQTLRFTPAAGSPRAPVIMALPRAEAISIPACVSDAPLTDLYSAALFPREQPVAGGAVNETGGQDETLFSMLENHGPVFTRGVLSPRPTGRPDRSALLGDTFGGHDDKQETRERSDIYRTYPAPTPTKVGLDRARAKEQRYQLNSSSVQLWLLKSCCSSEKHRPRVCSFMCRSCSSLASPRGVPVVERAPSPSIPLLLL